MSSRMGEWVNHNEQLIWPGNAVDVAVAQVISPTGRRLDYDVVRARYEGSAGLVVDHADRVLLIWRHRFIVDRWAWELPAGGMKLDEHPVAAAAREVEEECGWTTYAGRLMWSVPRCPERSDHIGHLVWLRAGDRVGPSDPEEVVQMEWLDRRQVHRLLVEQQIGDMFTLGALWWWLHVGPVLQ